MSTQKKYKIMWVVPEFHDLMKLEAAKKKMTIVDLSEKIARDKQLLEEKPESSHSKIKRGEWDFNGFF